LKKSDETTIHRNYRNINAYIDLLLSNAIQSLESIVANLSEPDVDSLRLGDRIELLSEYTNDCRREITGIYESRGGNPAASEAREMAEMENECVAIILHKIITQSLSGWTIIETRYRLGLNKKMNNDMVVEMLNFADG
jgi:hypothetical protein